MRSDDDVVIRPQPSCSGERTTWMLSRPHSIAALGGPAELIMIFDRDGQRAHVHHAAA